MTLEFSGERSSEAPSMTFFSVFPDQVDARRHHSNETTAIDPEGVKVGSNFLNEKGQKMNLVQLMKCKGQFMIGGPSFNLFSYKTSGKPNR